jgi:hypothetical protein
MTQLHRVHIRMTGDTQSMQAVRQALLDLQIEGLDIEIESPRSARKTDTFDVLTHGTITLAQQREVGDGNTRLF